MLSSIKCWILDMCYILKIIESSFLSENNINVFMRLYLYNFLCGDQ